MNKGDLLKRRTIAQAKRVHAFSRTLKQGVSSNYAAYLKSEAEENRIIEANL